MPLLDTFFSIMKRPQRSITINVENLHVNINNQISGDMASIETEIRHLLEEYVDNTIQEVQPDPWYATWWGILIITVSGGLVVARVSAFFGWI